MGRRNNLSKRRRSSIKRTQRNVKRSRIKRTQRNIKRSRIQKKRKRLNFSNKSRVKRNRRIRSRKLKGGAMDILDIKTFLKKSYSPSGQRGNFREFKFEFSRNAITIALGIVSDVTFKTLATAAFNKQHTYEGTTQIIGSYTVFINKNDDKDEWWIVHGNYNSLNDKCKDNLDDHTGANEFAGIFINAILSALYKGDKENPSGEHKSVFVEFMDKL